MLEEGKFVGDRYEILAKVGAGGMSDVYKAKDHVLGRFVAIKVLKQEFAEDVNFVTKFRTEAQSAAGLEHANIVNIYDVGSEDGIHYIVMEYIEGITLKTYIEKKRQLSYKETISIAIQVGRGIEAAHNKNIVHRDIKPQNIMISTEGKVKVTDFGIARAATSNTIHSDVMGSVHYSSPEQARNGFVDGKSDIYSLGIVMYEMVTGKVPFDGDTTVAIAIQHLQEEMVSPRSFVPDLPVSLEKIILKCTQKSADRRYASMGDLLDDLKHALVSPDEDFVVMVSPTSVYDKTRVISAEEVNQIKEETAGVHIRQEEPEPERPRPVPHRYEEEEEEEEDDGGFLNPKMEKAMTIMGIAAAVIILFIIIYLVGSMLGILKFGSSGKENKEQDTVTTSDHDLTDTDTNSDTDTKTDDEVTMIDLRGRELNEAQKELRDMGLKLFSLGTEASDEYDEGQIVSQDIAPDEKVKKDTTIKVTVSSGPGEFSVPNVVGNPSASAKSMLEAADLKVNPAYEYSDEAEDRVIRQEPSAGSQVKKGDTVTIYISQGREQVQVPDLRNQKEEDAVSMLTAKGLERGEVRSEYDDTIPAGKVISQTQQAGSSVYVGSKIDFVVSIGKKEVFYQLKHAEIGLPDNDEYVISANIQLSDADGTVLDTWNGVSISMFPYVISYTKDIATSTGTIVIEWVLEDEDGNISSQTQTKTVKFTQK